jgi:hypothetical protein
MTETIPVACTLAAHDLATQGRSWRELAAGTLSERVETPSGLRLVFQDGAGVAEELERLLTVERDCCAWARWELERARGALVVEVSSSGEGVTALHGMFTSLKP